jgi:hypothetical protein
MENITTGIAVLLSDQSRPHFPLASLPVELRLKIYNIGDSLQVRPNGSSLPPLITLLPEKDLYTEAYKEYKRNNAFMKIVNDGPGNISRISLEGFPTTIKYLVVNWNWMTKYTAQLKAFN